MILTHIYVFFTLVYTVLTTKVSLIGGVRGCYANEVLIHIINLALRVK